MYAKGPFSIKIPVKRKLGVVRGGICAALERRENDTGQSPWFLRARGIFCIFNSDYNLSPTVSSHPSLRSSV